MDQEELRQWEGRCIQEQPPRCTAACPLHVDVRAFVDRIRQGQWDEGMQVLRKTMPFPELLGRICDGPCRQACIRSQRGGAIHIHELERACVIRCQPSPPPSPLPARGQTVAVLGACLSSLTAAWDLVRKGVAVTVIDPGAWAGSLLVERYPDRLTSSLVSSRIDLLKQLGVDFQPGETVDYDCFLENVPERFQAVYIGQDGFYPPSSWPLERLADGGLWTAPRLYTTDLEGVFAGGLPAGNPSSPVWQAAEGRWAATSMDRFLQKVSLTAGREKEGLIETRLVTCIDEVKNEPAAVMADPEAGYSLKEALSEARRCLLCECMACVKVCPYLASFGAYPKKYAREIYNNESIVMGAHTANTLINSCSLCGLCETVCPENFPMQELCLQARQAMVRRGKMPPSAHEFALEDMAFSQSFRFALVRHAPDTTGSDFLFFPGCQLSASVPEKVITVYGYLRSIRKDRTGLMLDCCGAPAHWAGQEELFRLSCERLLEKWEQMGRPQIITACATCHQMFRENLAEIPVQSLWRLLAEEDLPEPAQKSASNLLAVHDPCTTRDEPEIQSAVRRILARLGIAVEKLPLSREKTECCGFGGLMQHAAPELSQTVAQRRAALSDCDYLAYCAMCRDSLAATGKRVVHLLDLMFPAHDQPDPASRKPAGLSRRRDNRTWLKDNLLASVWKESVSGKQPLPSTRLIISDNVRQLLEKRRILEEDIRQVIRHAEESGRRFRDPESGRFKASFRPRNVTFWVEYTPVQGGYEIHNAFGHRMEVRFP